MVNASLNWTSITGILLLILSIPAAISGVFQILFTLRKRADITSILVIKTIFLVLQSIARITLLPTSGAILFFQGWRLDPILQFGVTLISLGLITEMLANVSSEYYKFMMRPKKNRSLISQKIDASDLKKIRKPKVVSWYQVFIVFLMIFQATFLVGLFVIMVTGSSVGSGLPLSVVYIMFFLNVFYLIIYFVSLISPKTPWSWVLGTVLISLSVLSIILTPFAIALLIFWVRPEVKRFYGYKTTLEAE